MEQALRLCAHPEACLPGPPFWRQEGFRDRWQVVSPATGRKWLIEHRRMGLLARQLVGYRPPRARPRVRKGVLSRVSDAFLVGTPLLLQVVVLPLLHLFVNAWRN